MCGIAGIIHRDGKLVSSDLLDQMTDRMHHRGPDGRGTVIERNVGLGHRRLAIIDVDGGNQPLSNEDGSVQIVFNGEIYNYQELRQSLASGGHRFRTKSDTESIVHLWEDKGVDCVHDLRGMFAFAIYDRKRGTCFLARDRVGIKPLYYLQTQDSFYFASELKPLCQIPGVQLTVDPRAIDLYLQYQYVPAPHTIYKEIKKLCPGHHILLDIDDNSPADPKCYWNVQFAPDRTISEEQWIERIDASLRETVKTHLVSDVPFGAFLSGGIDSSTVVSYMSEIMQEPVSTFCIGHADAAYDERNWAEEAAKKCGASYREYEADSDGISLLPELVSGYGEPFADSSAIPTWQVSKLARQNVKMVLSGDGGDELFAGYHAYASLQSQCRTPDSPLLRVRNRIGNVARSVGLLAKNPTLASLKYDRTSVIQHETRRELWHTEYREVVDHTLAEFETRFNAYRDKDVISTLQRFDIENYIPYDNLTKVDIASMHHGLEVRVPLLDHRFIEVAAQVPPELKCCPTDGSGYSGLCSLRDPRSVVKKYLLKRNAERFFSKEFIYRPKRGFEIPVRNWFAGPKGNELRAEIQSPDSELSQFFRQPVLSRIAETASVDRKSAWQAWSLLVLAEWLRQNKV